MENKSIVKNGIYNVLYKSFNVVYPLIVASYLARTLLPEGVGKVSYAQNIVTYFTYIAVLGLPTYGTREVAKCCDDCKKSNTLFTELFSINGISTSICTIAYYTMVSIIPFFAEERLLYYVSGLLIVLNYFNVDWFYQGREEFKYIAIRSIVVKSISILAVFLFVHSKSDYVIYAFIHCAIYAGNYLLNILGLRKRVKFDFHHLNLRQHLGPLIVLLASSIAIELYTLLDTTMLGIWCNEEIVAYYSYAMKISKIIVTVIAAISAVLLPKLSYYAHNHNTGEFEKLISQAIIIFMLISFPCMIGLLLVSKDLIVVLFGTAFEPAILTSQILSLLIVPITFSTFFGSQVLCASGREKKMLVAVCCGAVTNIILNSILIPQFAQNGAAVASVVSEVVVMLIDLYFVVKFVHTNLDVKDIFKIIIALAVMSILVILTYKVNFNLRFIRLGVSVIVGAVGYISILIVTKEKYLIATLKKIRKKAT